MVILKIKINKSKSVSKFLILLFQSFKEHFKKSGAKRDRTVNLRLARAALSQLSYSPIIQLLWVTTK